MNRLAILLAAACLLAGVRSAGAEPPPRELAMQRIAALASAAGLHGEIALADRDGRVLAHVDGYADREARRPHRAGARWLWASVTKQVTAVLVMQQVDAGTLSLDGTIRRYLPEFPGASGERATVRQLLQHLSGLPNPDDSAPDAAGVPRFYGETGAGIADSARALGYCAQAPKAEPGAGFAYDNCDYLVLGAILERVTSRSYAQLVEQRIARPLGLASLRLARDGALRGGADAIGYAADGTRHPPLNVATFGAAGALTGTARDLLTLDRALLSGALLTAGGRDLLWRGDPQLGYQALGAWSFPAELRGCEAPVALIERRGDVAGIQVRNVIAPELGRALVVFTNDGGVDFGEVWQAKGLGFDLLSAAFCAQGGS